MRNRASHHNKFLREWQLLKACHEQGEAEEVWCTREDAKAVIDDLTEEEFDVLTAVLGHLFVLNERFPKASDVWNGALRNFSSARRSPGSAGLVEPVMWSAPRTYRSLMERTLRV